MFSKKAQRKIIKKISLLSVITLVFNMSMVGVFFVGENASANGIGDPNQECQAEGFDFGIARWVCDGEICGPNSWTVDGSSQGTSVYGTCEEAKWNVGSSGAAGIVIKAGLDHSSEIGSSGTATTVDQDLTHITFCGYAECGNGKTEGNEACDDGNNDNFDECNNTCEIQECVLDITKNTEDNEVESGDEIAYTLTIENTGTARCTGDGVKLHDYYDTNTTFVSATGSYDLNEATNYLKWNYGIMMPGDSKEEEVIVSVNNEVECESTITNSAHYWSDQTSDGSPVTADTLIICETSNPLCGDGIEENTAGEQCDDGNNDNGDGCSSDCLIEPECATDAKFKLNFSNITNTGLGNMASSTYAGLLASPFADDTWIPLVNNGHMIIDSDYNKDVPGLAIKRGAGEVTVTHFGSHPSGNGYEKVDANIIFNDSLISGFKNINLENQGEDGYYTDNAGEDEVIWIASTTNAEIHTRVTVHNDTFTIEYTCELPTCGDGVVNQDYEVCDDGNNIDGDFCSSDCAIERSVVVNEIMQNPVASSDTNGEWFEVYNTTDTPINLKNCIISDKGSNAHTIGSNLIVPALGYSVLGRNGNSALNGGYTADYVYNGFQLNNDDDEIIITCNGAIIDIVEYDGGTEFPDPLGISMILNSPVNDNNLGINWCTSSATYGAGDLGTPGFINDDCAGELEYGTLKICKYVDEDGVLESTDDQYPVGGWEFTVDWGTASSTFTTSYPAQEGDGCTSLIELEAGDYDISEVLGEGWYAIDPYNGATSTTVIANGEVVANFYNSQYSSISGHKYNDLNNNDKLDEGETELGDWEIQLIGCPYSPLDSGVMSFISKSAINTDLPPGLTGNCSVQATTTTDTNGYYTFSSLTPGDYGISEVNQANWTQTFPLEESFYYFNLGFKEATSSIDFLNHYDPPITQPFCGDGIVGNTPGEQCDGQSGCLTNCVWGGGGGIIITGGGGGGGGTPVVLGEEGEPVLTIEKTVNIEFANPGDEITYTVVITNTGNLTAFDVMLNDILPEGFTFAEDGSSDKILDLGDIEEAHNKTIIYNVLIGDEVKNGIYANLAEASASNHNPVFDSTDVEIRVVEVLGVELAPTGFSMKEFVALIVSSITLLGTAMTLRRRYA